MYITEEVIHNLKCIALKEFDEEESDKIQTLHKQLLLTAMKKNDSNEVGFLVNLINWEYIVIYGTENGISLKTVPQGIVLYFCTIIPKIQFSQKQIWSRF